MIPLGLTCCIKAEAAGAALQTSHCQCLRRSRGQVVTRSQALSSPCPLAALQQPVLMKACQSGGLPAAAPDVLSRLHRLMQVVAAENSSRIHRGWAAVPGCMHWHRPERRRAAMQGARQQLRQAPAVQAPCRGQRGTCRVQECSCLQAESGNLKVSQSLRGWLHRPAVSHRIDEVCKP